MDLLIKLGWNDTLEQAWHQGAHESYVPGRVVADYGLNYKVALPRDITAEVSGRLQYVSQQHELPKIGDWVAVQLMTATHGIIHEVLPRATEIGRKQPGEQFSKQVLATNVDIAFLVQALDHDFSPERIQRYLFQLQKEGVTPIVVLNKADKEADLEAKRMQLASYDVPIIVTSAVLNKGVEAIAAAIEPGKTAVFLGSSGVGKSTITNVLLGEDKQATRTIREADSKGRHTTTHRELFVLPNGGLIIDTPGLRELQLWGTEDDLSAAFSDIEELAASCKFSNCSHTAEPGCAVQAALAAGSLEKDRFELYEKFQKELQFLTTKIDEKSALERKHSFKKSQKHFNQIIRGKNDRKMFNE